MVVTVQSQLSLQHYRKPLLPLILKYARENSFRLVLPLREHGLGVVMISHNLHQVFSVADRIIVLRLGRRVATFEHGTSTPEDVVAAITGALEEAT